MTDEEINKKFDVVADHLASLAVGMQQLQEAQMRAERIWERTEGSVRALHGIVEIQAQEIKELGEAVRAVNGRQREADERQRHADERLNALINTVERYISEGRNRKS
ncbi:MAG: hypothetical protein H0T63_10650 [Pyrinomonadaceae bacterium]|nr:hypothetical protein [Pyrinomonadaceae bacterium]MDQ3584985.1 hypothetical protein [Acidobacteriota bacterium]